MTDKEYMAMALQLAKKGRGWVNPNPMVGAVLVKDGRVIGQGWHQKFGELHAERNALAACTQDPRGATLYVTLEPCCHWGKTPPCTQAVLEAGITRVVVGSADPNPLVGGKGVRLLREHGVQVTEGVLRKECDQLNEAFLYYIQTGLPFVTLKYAMSLDGKIAAASGKSKWITGEAARQHVQQERAGCAAILTGVGTVLADDPALTCRIPDTCSPVRVVCDTWLRTPPQAQVVVTAPSVRTLLATCCTDTAKQAVYRAAGCEILQLPEADGHVNLTTLLHRLGELQLSSVLAEGGARLNWSLLKTGLVSKVQAYLAPKLLGGTDAKSPVGGAGLNDPNHAFCFTAPQVTRLGEDLLLESEALPCSLASLKKLEI